MVLVYEGRRDVVWILGGRECCNRFVVQDRYNDCQRRGYNPGNALVYVVYRWRPMKSYGIWEGQTRLGTHFRGR